MHRLRYPAEFFRQLEKLVYYVLFPALLFSSINQAHWSLGEASLLLVAVILLAAGAICLAWLAAPLLKPDSNSMGSIAQCGFRFNTYLGLSLAQAVAGAQGTAIMALVVGLAIPICNIAAVSGMAQGRGKRHLLKAICQNPLILATVFAFFWNIAQLPLPSPIAVSLQRLGVCALGLGLLCVGATLSLQGIKGQQTLILWVNVVKLFCLPLLALLIGLLLPLSLLERQMLLVYSALPTASSAHVLAAQMGGNARLVALTMSIGTLCSALTIPIWLSLFNFA